SRAMRLRGTAGVRLGRGRRTGLRPRARRHPTGRRRGGRPRLPGAGRPRGDRASMRRIVIVAAGPAGRTASRELRRHGFDGELTVIGAEPHAPYRRPPLSKEFLRADVDLGLRGGEELAADWRLGQAATGLDLAGRQVLCGPGEPVAFDGLVIATGLRARTLPGASRRPGVIALRGVDDALALRAALSSRPRVVVAGGGFLGVELALTLRSMDLPVTLVASDRVPLRAPLGDHAGGIIAG